MRDRRRQMAFQRELKQGDSEMTFGQRIQSVIESPQVAVMSRIGSEPTANAVAGQSQRVCLQVQFVAIAYHMFEDSIGLLKLCRILSIRSRSVVWEHNRGTGLARQILHQRAVGLGAIYSQGPGQIKSSQIALGEDKALTCPESNLRHEYRTQWAICQSHWQIGR